MSEVNINLYFGDNSGAGGTENDPLTPGATPNPESPEQIQKSSTTKDVMTETEALCLYVGKQGFNMVTSRVGTTTRSNVNQQKTNGALKAVGYAAMIIKNPYLGIAAVGLDILNSQLDWDEKKSVEQRRSEIIKGRISASNGSR